MRELKIQCDCGQKYKFDVEPVNGLMPFSVNCPIFGVDGTEKANQALRPMTPPPVARVTAPRAVPVAVPVAAASLVPAPPSSAPRLRIGAAAVEPAASSPSVAEAAAPLPIAPIAAAAQPAGAAAATPAKKPSFALGLLGGLIGALVGSLIYFLVFRYSGVRIKLLAIGVGYLAGLGAELLGRKEGSKELGMITAALALAGIVGAQYAVSRIWWNESSHAIAKLSSYETRVTDAKKVATAIPNGSDQEIRLYLAKQAADEGEKPDPKAITDDEVKEFRETSLPETRDLASGKLTKVDYEKKHTEEMAAASKADGEPDEGTFKAFFLVLLISRLNIFSLIAAAGLAFKLCANA
jgi:hypothetical protein